MSMELHPLVQGKTMEEWAEEGRLNETRESHVHPEAPEGRPATQQERDALVASLTADEKVMWEQREQLEGLLNRLQLIRMLGALIGTEDDDEEEEED